MIFLKTSHLDPKILGNMTLGDDYQFVKPLITPLQLHIKRITDSLEDSFSFSLNKGSGNTKSGLQSSVELSGDFFKISVNVVRFGNGMSYQESLDTKIHGGGRIYLRIWNNIINTKIEKNLPEELVYFFASSNKKVGFI